MYLLLLEVERLPGIRCQRVVGVLILMAAVAGNTFCICYNKRSPFIQLSKRVLLVVFLREICTSRNPDEQIELIA